MARPTPATTLFALLFAGGTAHAQSRDDPGVGAPNPALVELGVSGFARADFADFCRTEGDLVTCTQGRTFMGLGAAPRLRLSRLLSLGALASYAWKVGTESTVSSDGSHEDQSLTSWRLEAEGRFHPVAHVRPDPWLGVDVGVTSYRDTRTLYVNGGRSGSSVSETESALVVGASAGGDLMAAPFFAFGAELRGSLFTYGEGLAVTAAIGLTGTFLVAP